jgi:pilus assembly protein CpaF
MRELLAERGTTPDQLRAYIEQYLTGYQREAGTSGRPRLLDPAGSSERIAAHLLGEGPLVPLLGHPRISDIWVNGPKRILYRLDGEVYLVDDVFDGDEDVQQLLKRWLAPLGLRSPDVSWPFVDARLPNGARLHAAMPPATTRYTVLSLRLFSVAARSLAQLIWPEEQPVEEGPHALHGQRVSTGRAAEVWAPLEAPLRQASPGQPGMLPPALGNFLLACVATGVPIVISGAPGSGKTTLLRALSGGIPPWARLVTLEDTLELDVEDHLANAVALLTRPPNVEKKGAITLRHLVREALRMAPDYVVVGEVRGEETWDLLNALQNGCSALATIHGLNCEDALERIAMRALEAGTHMSYDQLLQFVAACVGIVVQVRREPAPRPGQPRHRVVQVYEVVGVTADRTRVQGHDLWALDARTDQLVWTGTTPRCLARIRDAGVPYAPPAVRPGDEGGS